MKDVEAADQSEEENEGSNRRRNLGNHIRR